MTVCFSLHNMSLIIGVSDKNSKGRGKSFFLSLQWNALKMPDFHKRIVILTFILISHSTVREHLFRLSHVVFARSEVAGAALVGWRWETLLKVVRL